MCTKGVFYSADGGHLGLRKAANSGSGQQLAVLANDIFFKISTLVTWHPHHEFSHPFFEDQHNYERFALQTFEEQKESLDQFLAFRGTWSGLVRLYHDGISLSLKNLWEVRKVVQIVVVANKKHQWGGLIPLYCRFYVLSLTRNTLLILEATPVLETTARSIPDRTILHGKIFCFYSCKVSVWKVSYSFKLPPNSISKPPPGFWAVCAKAGPLSLCLWCWASPGSWVCPLAFLCSGAGSLCGERAALAAGPARGTDRGMPGSASRAWTPWDARNGETGGKFWLARDGSRLPVSRQGCWHPTEPQVELPNSRLHSRDLGAPSQAPVILPAQEGGTIAAPECQ